MALLYSERLLLLVRARPSWGMTPGVKRPGALQTQKVFPQHKLLGGRLSTHTGQNLPLGVGEVWRVGETLAWPSAIVFAPGRPDTVFVWA